MLGFSLENLTQEEVKEDFLVRREYLDNGIRVVTVEALDNKDDIKDSVLTMECIGEEPVLQMCLDSLKAALKNSGGEISDEMRSAVVQTGRCLNSYVRGICGINEEMEHLPKDGIIYISVPALRPGDEKSVQGQMDVILEQLKKYSE